ncbi:GGDEF domain-containing protein [Mesorhizobium sp. CA13]|uniref:GGDEF domain-containing protein n=1 Tax=Mesorhizobium sp. CA13 TaxID=2876643 RepID=UPI001CCD314F|nr:GGDEF domain-containing protein [Mesorhizobium sp. CA13]MBZ9857243.1 GGDEF domain-containing protein [Mesorhizobium sp. CA13]
MAQAETTATEPVWKGVAWLAFLGTIGSLALSVGLNYLLLFSDVLTPFGRSMVTAVLLPLIIGLPLFVLIGLKQAQIRGYRRELNRAETYDRVTGCLNGPVFTSMVERRAARPSAPGPRSGAFLVIHAEHLRSINLRFGPDWGDEALRLVASAIQSAVRKEDMVGRIGTSMFGVFLPGTTEAEAAEIGERIRASVAQVYFAPKGTEDALTISLGSTVFETELAFEDMFRSAEAQLSARAPAETRPTGLQ